jgi:hypothetical protein
MAHLVLLGILLLLDVPSSTVILDPIAHLMEGSSDSVQNPVSS